MILTKSIKLTKPCVLLENTARTESSQEIKGFEIVFFSTSSVLAYLTQREEGGTVRLCCCYAIQSAEDGVKADQTAGTGETGKHRVPASIQKCLLNKGLIESDVTARHLSN